MNFYVRYFNMEHFWLDGDLFKSNLAQYNPGRKSDFYIMATNGLTGGPSSGSSVPYSSSSFLTLTIDDLDKILLINKIHIEHSHLYGWEERPDFYDTEVSNWVYSYFNKYKTQLQTSTFGDDLLNREFNLSIFSGVPIGNIVYHNFSFGIFHVGNDPAYDRIITL